VRGLKGLYLRGGTDRTGDLILTNEFLKRTLLVVLPAILIQILIRAFLGPDPVYCGVQSRTSQCCLAAAGGSPAPWNTILRNSVSVLYIFFPLIINIISIISVISKICYIEFVSLSPFSSFLSSSGGRVGFNREHLSPSSLPPCFKS